MAKDNRRFLYNPIRNCALDKIDKREYSFKECINLLNEYSSSNNRLRNMINRLHREIDKLWNICRDKDMTDDEIIAMIGGIGLGVECVFSNIEDNYEIRVEVASEILNKLQDKYIKSKENIRYWESL